MMHSPPSSRFVFPRSLYSTDFVRAGCPSADYDPTTQLDDLTSTWATNLVVLAVALLAALVQRRCRSLSRLYFVGTGLAFGIAGVGHAVLESSDDNHTPYVLTSAICQVVAQLGLQWWVWGQSQQPQPQPQPESTSSSSSLWQSRILVWRRWLFWTMVLVLVIWVIIGIATDQQELLGAYVPLSQVLVGLDIGLLGRCYVAGVGSALFVAGTVVYVSLAPTCGDAGYETCWQDCPLPNPIAFNHNGLFHVLVVLGVLLQGLEPKWTQFQSTTMRTPECSSAAAEEEGTDPDDADEEQQQQ